MTSTTFELLTLWPPIEQRKQIAVTVWDLANQETCGQISDHFNISMSSVSRCIDRVVRALVDLRTELIQWPRGNNVMLVFTYYDKAIDVLK